MYTLERPGVLVFSTLGKIKEVVGQENIDALAAIPEPELRLLGAGLKLTAAFEAQRTAYLLDRAASYLNVLTNAEGKFVSAKEGIGIFRNVRNMEATGDWMLSLYQFKYKGLVSANEGLDLHFVGLNRYEGFHAFSEAKYAGGLGSLKTFTPFFEGGPAMFRQGSEYYIGSRLATYVAVGGEFSLQAEKLMGMLRTGWIKSYAGIGNKLYELPHYSMNINFKLNPPKLIR